MGMRLALARTASGVLFLAIAGVATWTLGAERDAPYPVRWSPMLELASLADIDARFDETLPAGRQFRLRDLHGTGDQWTAAPGRVMRCADAFGSTSWYTAGTERQRLDDFMARCFALHRLHWAKPAAHSLLDDLRSDATLLDRLPADFVLFSDDTQRLIQEARYVGTPPPSLGAYLRGERLPLPEVRPAGDTPDWSARLIFGQPGLRLGPGHIRELAWLPLAFADFDGDGHQDVLAVLRRLWVRDDFPDDLSTDDSVYLLTRTAESEPLRVIADYTEYLSLHHLPPLPGWDITSWVVGEAPPGLIPPRWAPSLGLASLDEVDAKLARPVWPDDPEGLELWRYQSTQPSEEWDRAVMYTCLDQMRLMAEGYEGQINPDHKLFIGIGADCAALAAMRDARPSKLSHVADFRLDASAPRFLPPHVTSPINYDGIRDLRQMAREGTSWRGEDWPGHMTVESDRVTVYEDRDMAWATRIELLARADFDGDGIEDLMVGTGNWATEGTYGASDLLILTRFGEDEVFRVLSDWSCPECLPGNPWPSNAPPEFY